MRPLHRVGFDFQLWLRHIDHLVVLIELVDGAAGPLGFLGCRTLAVVLIQGVIRARLAVAGDWQV